MLNLIVVQALVAQDAIRFGGCMAKRCSKSAYSAVIHHVIIGSSTGALAPCEIARPYGMNLLGVAAIAQAGTQPFRGWPGTSITNERWVKAATC